MTQEAIPQSGGTWIRQADGSLRLIPEGLVPAAFAPEGGAAVATAFEGIDPIVTPPAAPDTPSE